MRRWLAMAPVLGVILDLSLHRGLGAWHPLAMGGSLLALLLCLAALLARWRGRGELTPVGAAMAGFCLLVAGGLWLWPGLGRLWAAYPEPLLYAVLLAMAGLPQLLGLPPFTTLFARRTAPPRSGPAMPSSASTCPGLVLGRALLPGREPDPPLPPGPGLAPLAPGEPARGNHAFPHAGVGWPSLGATPTGTWPGGPALPRQLKAAAASPAPAAPEVPSPKEAVMFTRPDGSGGERLPPRGPGQHRSDDRDAAARPGRGGPDLVVVNLTELDIGYCVGCGLCIEKGQCWQADDHAGVVEKLLAAQAVVLASPVYFGQVTAQFKTFLDRCLVLGHQPRPGGRKPGLAVAVSAGMGETAVADYLAGVLRVFGADPVGRFTALATSPGEFYGKDLVEAEGRELGRRLARAVKEKRRRPASDHDLFFYLFMRHLVSDNRELMRADYRHWQETGILGELRELRGTGARHHARNPAARDAWLKEMIQRRRHPGKPAAPAARRRRRPAGGRRGLRHLPGTGANMPRAFDPAAAAGLAATIQFEISGGEIFTAHLAIADGRCQFREGPAAGKANLLVRSPAAVWLGIAKGELNGQAAFLAGQYQAEGDLSLLMRLGRLFGRT